MTDFNREKLLEGRAYALFHREYSRRLEHVGQFILGGVDVEETEDIKRTFHTLKGGAGFFGFSEIADVAAQIEKACSEISSVTELLQFIQDGCQKLDELGQGLPAPVASPDKKS